MLEFANELFVEESTVRFYGCRVQTRMAAIRLPGARLLLYSPVRLTARLRQEMKELGEISFIVSPNKIHNQTLAGYRTAFPAATLFVPPGLPERRPTLSFDAVLSKEPVTAWQPDLQHVLTRGNVFFSEALLFHSVSRTLLVGDFVERIGIGLRPWKPRPVSIGRFVLTVLAGVGCASEERSERGESVAPPEWRACEHHADCTWVLGEAGWPAAVSAPKVAEYLEWVRSRAPFTTYFMPGDCFTHPKEFDAYVLRSKSAVACVEGSCVLRVEPTCTR